MEVEILESCEKEELGRQATVLQREKRLVVVVVGGCERCRPTTWEVGEVGGVEEVGEASCGRTRKKRTRLSDSGLFFVVLE